MNSVFLLVIAVAVTGCLAAWDHPTEIAKAADTLKRAEEALLEHGRARSNITHTIGELMGERHHLISEVARFEANIDGHEDDAKRAKARIDEVSLKLLELEKEQERLSDLDAELHDAMHSARMRLHETEGMTEGPHVIAQHRDTAPEYPPVVPDKAESVPPQVPTHEVPPMPEDESAEDAALKS